MKENLEPEAPSQGQNFLDKATQNQVKVNFDAAFFLRSRDGAWGFVAR